MTTRETAATERALARLAADPALTITAAADQSGIARSTLIRALRRRGVEPRPPVPGKGRERAPLPDPYYFHDGTPLKPRPARRSTP